MKCTTQLFGLTNYVQTNPTFKDLLHFFCLTWRNHLLLIFDDPLRWLLKEEHLAEWTYQCVADSLICWSWEWLWSVGVIPSDVALLGHIHLQFMYKPSFKVASLTHGTSVWYWWIHSRYEFYCREVHICRTKLERTLVEYRQFIQWFARFEVVCTGWSKPCTPLLGQDGKSSGNAEYSIFEYNLFKNHLN